MFNRLLLFEKVGDSAPHGIGSLLVISDKDGVVVSARELIAAMGREFYVSTDGTSQNLRLLEAFREVPIPGKRVEPFVYVIELGKPVG